MEAGVLLQRWPRLQASVYRQGTKAAARRLGGRLPLDELDGDDTRRALGHVSELAVGLTATAVRSLRPSAAGPAEAVQN